MRQGQGQVLGKDFGVEILLHGLQGFAGPIFHGEAVFQEFEGFFREPALMVKFGEGVVDKGFLVHQGGAQDFRLPFSSSMRSRRKVKGATGVLVPDTGAENTERAPGR